jgi:hypothetical protein
MVACTLMATILTITPFAIYVGNCPLASSVQASILQLFQAYHSESVFSQVYRYLPHLSITRVTKTHLFSHQRITTARWSATSHLKSVNARLWDNIPLRAYQPCSVRNDLSSLTPMLTTSPQTKISISKCDSHYLSISQYDHELATLPRVYSSRSCVCPLFHPRNHALLSLLVSRS